MKTALIIGSQGQDGTYLNEHLFKKNYRVFGIGRVKVQGPRRGSSKPLNILNAKDVRGFLKKHRPDEIYYLAAYHHSSENLQGDPVHLLRQSFAVHVEGLGNVLEALRVEGLHSRVFYAASSHIFGNVSKTRQNESTPMNPDCTYGLTKAAGRQLCHLYRQHHGLFISVGILYNHESPLRAPHFVSQKIVRAAWEIKLGRQKELVLGNLKAKVDWGYAGDYVVAMHKILQARQSDDFIVSSGSQHTVGEFTKGVFDRLGLDYKRYVREDPALLKKSGSRQFYGDQSKLTRQTGWKPKVSFRKLISIMVDAHKECHG